MSSRFQIWAGGERPWSTGNELNLLELAYTGLAKEVMEGEREVAILLDTETTKILRYEGSEEEIKSQLEWIFRKEVNSILDFYTPNHCGACGDCPCHCS